MKLSELSEFELHALDIVALLMAGVLARNTSYTYDEAAQQAALAAKALVDRFGQLRDSGALDAFL